MFMSLVSVEETVRERQTKDSTTNTIIMIDQVKKVNKNSNKRKANTTTTQTKRK